MGTHGRGPARGASRPSCCSPIPTGIGEAPIRPRCLAHALPARTR